VGFHDEGGWEKLLAEAAHSAGTDAGSARVVDARRLTILRMGARRWRQDHPKRLISGSLAFAGYWEGKGVAGDHVLVDRMWAEKDIMG